MMRGGLNPGARQWLLAVSLLLLCASMLPARYIDWVGAVGNLATRLIAPASHPISMVTRWVVPAERQRDGPTVRALQREREEFRALWLREQEENSRLRRIITELQQGLAYDDLPVRRLHRPIIGSGSDGSGGSLIVRAGTTEGVEKNAVATTAGVQLVGRIIDAGSRTSYVRLINDRRTGERIKGLVVAEDGERGGTCVLHPIRDGLLQGLVSGRDVPVPKPGQRVHLHDEEWPRHSQMLVIGQIERVDRGDHGWHLLTVRPTVELDRVSEVVLRFTPEQDTRAIGSAGGQR